MQHAERARGRERGRAGEEGKERGLTRGSTQEECPPFIEALAAALDKREEVLDVGCGTGFVTSQLQVMLEQNPEP